MSIKVYLFKEDPPFLNLNIGPVTIGFTKRNLIYITTIAGIPTFLVIISLLGGGNLILWLAVDLIAIIIGYVLSIFRIENIPIDRFILNKLIFGRKKDKNENFENSIDFSKGKKFEDVINLKINKLINKKC